MATLEVQVRTLTPLWTGGVDGTMDRIHETGLLGSLRWWYEAIVRSLGGWACDPTEHVCTLSGENLKKYKDARSQGKVWREALDEAGICDACKVFGTTEWQRRFRLEVIEDRVSPVWDSERPLNIRPPGRTRGWFLPPGWMGEFTLKITGEPQVLTMLSALMLFLERWGSLGSKSLLGYGVFLIKNRHEILKMVEKWEWGKIEEVDESRNESALPDLRQFGFLRYRIVNPHPAWWTHVSGIERVASKVQPLVKYKTVPVMPALKNEWRFNRWKGSKRIEREIFGFSDVKIRQRSRIAVSWAYQISNKIWEIRGWVWLDEKASWSDKLWQILTNSESWKNALRTEGELESHKIKCKKDVISLVTEVLK